LFRLSWQLPQLSRQYVPGRRDVRCRLPDRVLRQRSDASVHTVRHFLHSLLRCVVLEVHGVPVNVLPACRAEPLHTDLPRRLLRRPSSESVRRLSAAVQDLSVRHQYVHKLRERLFPDWQLVRAESGLSGRAVRRDQQRPLYQLCWTLRHLHRLFKHELPILQEWLLLLLESQPVRSVLPVWLLP
jgi:hypothetical protein